MAEVTKEIELEIAHVLFIDIVGYSKLVVEKQRRLLELLNQIVRATEQVRKAEANNRLITIPTGDGMALVFYNTPEAPVECALEISRAAKAYPELKLRMGIHSGAVSGIIDVSGRANIAGAGINIAQRVMDCGDAGHILLSKHVAEDLEQLGHWKRCLHDLGEIEVKHGARVSVANLYTDELGNPAMPQKFVRARKAGAPVVPAKSNKKWMIAAAAALLAAVVIALLVFTTHRTGNTTAAQAREGHSAAVSPVISDKSIAVLPFENLSRDPENAFFADGVQDEILTDLSKIADLKVISRSSVMHYKSGIERNLREIGNELGVAHLLEGSVQRSGNRVRVNAQLIDARNDAHLWAQTYDRDLADVFAIQSEIAKTIADQLQAKLSASEESAISRAPTQDLEAFDLYSRARTLMLNVSFTNLAADNLRQAVGLLEQAVARDPNFAAAYVSMADAHDQLYAVQGDHTAARLASAEAAIARLRELRPNAGETHLAIARHRYFAFRDYAGARDELTAAAASLPNEPSILALSAFIDRRANKWDESVHELSQAIDRDPRNTFWMQQQSLTYLNLRRFAEMKAILDRALVADPTSVETRLAKGACELRWLADSRPLHNEIDDAIKRAPDSAALISGNWVLLACCERDSEALARAVPAVGSRGFVIASIVGFDSHFGEALISYLRNDAPGFKQALLQARVAQEDVVRHQPNYGPAISALGLIDAMLANKEQAISEGRRAMELIPVTKDALIGAELIQVFAAICAWSGDKDQALEHLTKAASIPSFVNYGELKLHPMWDPLRGDPRFEKIVASLAPR